MITGLYAGVSGVYHAFLRYPEGEIASFELREAGTSSGQGTASYSINSSSEVTGPYFDTNGASHGFLRTKEGAINNSTRQEQAQGADRARPHIATTGPMRSLDSMLTQTVRITGSSGNS